MAAETIQTGGTDPAEPISGRSVDSRDRVLSLDGGGIRGLIILDILEAIEKEAGKPIEDLFDWIGGTSTGGIIALAIARGKSISYIRDMYHRMKDTVFKGPKPYDSATIENLLQEEFGLNVMTDIKHPKVVVTSTIATAHPYKLHLFRSYEKSTSKADDTSGPKAEKECDQYPPNLQFIWKVARSTSAAPIYFEPFKQQFIDGGILANNPTLHLLTERRAYDSKNKMKVVVSLGTGVPPPTPVVPYTWKFDWKHPVESSKAMYRFLTSFLPGIVGEIGQAGGEVVIQAEAFCKAEKAKFYRLSPPITADIPLDCTDDAKLQSMKKETQKYIEDKINDIKEIAQLLTEEETKSYKDSIMQTFAYVNDTNFIQSLYTFMSRKSDPQAIPNSQDTI